MTDQRLKPTCPHCGRQDCGTAEQIPTWDIVCDAHYTYNPDGSYTTHRGDEHGFGSFARDREDYLVDEIVALEEDLAPLRTKAQAEITRATRWKARAVEWLWAYKSMEAAYNVAIKMLDHRTSATIGVIDEVLQRQIVNLQEALENQRRLYTEMRARAQGLRAALVMAAKAIQHVMEHIPLRSTAHDEAVHLHYEALCGVGDPIP